MGFAPESLLTAVRLDVAEASPSYEGSHLFPDCTYRQFCCSTLVSNLLRKLVPRNSKQIDDVTYQEFCSVNTGNDSWSDASWFESDHLLFNQLVVELDDFFHPKGMPLIGSYTEILDKGRTGPGVSVGSIQQSCYSKLFDSPLTATSERLYRVYRGYIANHPRWEAADDQRSLHRGSVRVVDGSNIRFVPKTNERSRMICVEPTLNSFFQLGVGAIFEDRLKSIGIDLSTQPVKNRRLARIGSIRGSYSTIDLSSASDSISLKLCARILPKWLYELLMEVRSPFSKYNGQMIQLQMMSTMGNGFTFPLQTIIFACIVRSVYRLLDLKVDGGLTPNYGVFGDDIICKSLAFNRVIRLLHLCGFKPNPRKTFSEGPFRESCGADWFTGRYCRPVYIKYTASGEDTHVAINLLNRWSALTSIALPRAVQYLMSCLGRIYYVPFTESDDAGVKVPFHLLDRPKFRFGSPVYSYRQVVPSRISVDCEGNFRYPRGYRRRFKLNPHGLFLSFLRGELVNGVLTIRHNDSIYRTKRRSIPFWDYAGQSIRSDGMRMEWRRWETAVWVNLIS